MSTSKAKSGPVKASRLRLLVALAGVALLAVLVLWAFPTRSWLAQRAATKRSQQELVDLDAQNAALERRIERLQTPAEIERIARKEYGLVRPGEEAYAILPSPAPPVSMPDVWPFQGLADSLNR